jgi:hypothetical protein
MVAATGVAIMIDGAEMIDGSVTIGGVAVMMIGGEETAVVIATGSRHIGSPSLCDLR